MKAGEMYADQRQQFTDSDWKLYQENGDAAEKWFISYKGTRFVGPSGAYVLQTQTAASESSNLRRWERKRR